MSKEKVKPILDSNEASQNPEMTEVFILHEDIEDYSIEPLDEGDIKIGDCLFERKESSDFASSLQEGRLRDQVERMGERDMNSFILVEGDMDDFENLSHTDIPAKSLRGMVASVIVRNNIPVVFCSNPRTLADMAIRLARKTVEDPTGVQTKTTDTMKEPSFIENLFLGIDGIGYKTAQSLADEFTNLESVYKAEKDDFETVSGIGSKTASKIHQNIHNDKDSSESDATEDDDSVEIVTI